MPVALQSPINWGHIADAVQFYETQGYRHVEVPWIVPQDVTRATAPAFVTPLATPEGDLIGSGEQGLLHMALRGELPPGKYQTTTACWRDDPVDELHGRHFVKVELMHLKPDPTPKDRDVVLLDAALFFITRGWILVEKVPMFDEPHQVDIRCATTDIELGSYGIRSFRNVSWVYGTGCAEPRFSTVLSKNKELAEGDE